MQSEEKGKQQPEEQRHLNILNQEASISLSSMRAGRYLVGEPQII